MAAVSLIPAYNRCLVDSLLKDIISILIDVFVIAYCTSWLIFFVLLFLSILAGFSPKFYEYRLKKAGKEYVDGSAAYAKKITDILSGKRKSYGHAKVDGNTISGAVVCLIDILVFALCGVFF